MYTEKTTKLKAVNPLGTCRLASEGPFCRAQADKVLKAFTT